MSADFNEKSSDAMFARILQRMDSQDATLFRIESALSNAKARVETLERARWYQRGIVAVIAVAATSAWQYLTRK